MQEYSIPSINKNIILALGAESAGNFSIFSNSKIYFSQDFGNLLDEENYDKYKSGLFSFLKRNTIRPDIILCDLHPLFYTTQLAQKLANKYGAKLIPIQHHVAHVFSAIGDEIISTGKIKYKKEYLGIACDGTGYAEDGKIWGGEILKISSKDSALCIQRFGHLENQILLGGELAIREPVRVLISILSKFKEKKEVYSYVKKYYSKNEFELLWNQLIQNFNCLETSSTARILDAVSVLLKFSENKMLSKHEPVKLLEQNSTKPFVLEPVIEFNKHEEIWVLKTTPLFEYLIKNLDKDKKRLAATAQKYIASGLSLIIKNQKNTQTYFAGGMANNKIISQFLESRRVYVNKKIPRGDAGISFGQIFLFLLTNSGN